MERNDLESIEAILNWRTVKADSIGLTEVDHQLLRQQDNAQNVIISAAIANCYPIVKTLHADGYHIIDKIVDDRFVFSKEAETCYKASSVDMMEKHIDRIRIFKAQASPAYMALTYIHDPISHAFDYTTKAALGIYSPTLFYAP